LHNRFVVGGYMRKRVTLRISKGLRAVALAAGISRRVYSDTRVIFITIYIALAEKIGTPLIKVVIENVSSSDQTSCLELLSVFIMTRQLLLDVQNYFVVVY
jgi:hypothetical protein